jgi:hypothetical protein
MPHKEGIGILASFDVTESCSVGEAAELSEKRTGQTKESFVY